MAFTATLSGDWLESVGNRRASSGTINITSYTTGGETPGTSLGIGVIKDIQFGQGSNGFIYAWNPTTGKIQVFRGIGGTGVTAYAPGGGDIKGSTNTDSVGGVGIALPTNGNLIATLAAANNTTALTIALQPDNPRNISIALKNNTGGASAGNASTYTIVGTFRGLAQTETIAFTAPDLATIANTSVAIKFGSKPFDTITSITPSVAQPANWQHGAGPGSKLGLPADISAAASVTKVTKNAADIAVTADATNMTVNAGVLADGDDVSIEFLAIATQSEAASATNVGTVSFRTIGL